MSSPSCGVTPPRSAAGDARQRPLKPVPVRILLGRKTHVELARYFNLFAFNVLAPDAGFDFKTETEQLAWLEADLKGRSASMPIVVFAHIPLWVVYPQWGWGTDDGARALEALKRFGSVTVLNGHIHQVMQKVEGNVAFHTARSTAFPQPSPGTAPSPGPMKVAEDKLRTMLGVASVSFKRGEQRLAIIDTPLAAPINRASRPRMRASAVMKPSLSQFDR